MIEQVLSAPVATAEMFGDCPDTALFPEEYAVIAKAVESRRREFITARVCARRALARLGQAPVPVLPGLRGAPQWPEGVTGSITHCDGYRAAAVALAKDVVSIGVDAEPDEPLPDHRILDLIARDEERARLADLAAKMPNISWDRLLFSAKESVYKTWFPLARCWLDFESADVVIDPHEGMFTARLLVPGPPVGGSPLDLLRGRWFSGRGLLVTAIAVSCGSR
jgi:4'-phosphopantetheinyl transferase EntD